MQALTSLAATAWDGRGKGWQGANLGVQPTVVLYTIESGNILEYRFNDTANGLGLLNVAYQPNPWVSIAVPSDLIFIADSASLTATNAYDIGENSLDLFVYATVGGVAGIYQYYANLPGLVFSAGGLLHASTNIHWMSAATYMSGSEQPSLARVAVGLTRTL